MADGERPGPDNPIRVFLLDDHEVVRRGVRELLEDEPDITVVGEAGTVEQATVRVPALRPQVAVLDVRLPDGDGVTLCRDLRSRLPELACLMLTSFDDEDALLDSIMAGASGYVLKQIQGTDLVSAVRTVASGQSLLDPSATTKLMARLREGKEQQEEPEALPGLTPGAGDPRSDRRGPDQPADRPAALPRRENSEEPHLPPPGQTRRGTAHPGRGDRHPGPGPAAARRPLTRTERPRIAPVRPKPRKPRGPQAGGRPRTHAGRRPGGRRT